MSGYNITSKSLLSYFKEAILSNVYKSTKNFYGAYILKEKIIGKRITIDVLFVYSNEDDELDSMIETCFEIFNYVEMGRIDILMPLYSDGLDFSINIKPHYMTLIEFKNLSKDDIKKMEKKKISYYNHNNL